MRYGCDLVATAARQTRATGRIRRRFNTYVHAHSRRPSPSPSTTAGRQQEDILLRASPPRPSITWRPKRAPRRNQATLRRQPGVHQPRCVMPPAGRRGARPSDVRSRLLQVGLLEHRPSSRQRACIPIVRARDDGRARRLYRAGVHARPSTMNNTTVGSVRLSLSSSVCLTVSIWSEQAAEHRALRGALPPWTTPRAVPSDFLPVDPPSVCLHLSQQSR